MRKILFLSDIHIRPEGQTIIGIDTFARCEAALAHAFVHHPDIALVVLCGDLAHSGKVEEYQRLKPLIEACPAPVQPMMGNHDNRENFGAVFPDMALTADGHLQAAHDIGDWRVLTLDTLDGPPFRNDHHAGFLCDKRLAWLEERLADAPDRPALVAAHHPPMDVGFPGIDGIKLANGDALLDLLSRHDQVQHLCLGHVHRTISGSYRGLGFTVFKSTSHQMPMDLLGTSTLSSTAEPGAYGLALLAEHAIIHSEDFEIAEVGIESYDAHPD